MKTAALVVALAASAFAQSPSVPAQAPLREFTSVNIQVKGNKIWTPAVFIVKKGDRVRIKLINAAPSGPHGFAIEGYGVKTVVDDKPGHNVKFVEFTADKAGIFRVYCQLHPAHVGGQLLVLE